MAEGQSGADPGEDAAAQGLCRHQHRQTSGETYQCILLNMVHYKLEIKMLLNPL